MEVTLSPDLSKQVEQELASGRYQNLNQLVEEALQSFLDQRRRAERRLDALRRIGQAVDRADRYERVLVPGQK